MTCFIDYISVYPFKFGYSGLIVFPMKNVTYKLAASGSCLIAGVWWFRGSPGKLFANGSSPK
jgi:hypothetical protein